MADEYILFGIGMFVILILLALEEVAGGLQNVFYMVLVILAFGGLLYIYGKPETTSTGP
jgi:hypothetical protein